MRRQIVDQLLRQTPFDLPTDLVAREEKSTIRRLVAQLKREGMSDKEIRASEAQIRANAHETTLRSLKELLLLAKIAEAEEIEVDEETSALEIEAMAARTDESVRRVRARVEKEGGPDSLDDPDPRAEGRSIRHPSKTSDQSRTLPRPPGIEPRRRRRSRPIGLWGRPSTTRGRGR